MRQLDRLFVTLSLTLLGAFFLALWKDFDREWKPYQNTFAKLESDKSGGVMRRGPWILGGYDYAQIVVAGGVRVDRCIMCHRGAEDPRFAAAAQPYRTHPDVGPHAFEKFGCTACHGGQGRATTVRAAHGKVAFWEEPMLRGPYLQSACGTCHRSGDLPQAPLLTQGRRLYMQRGCVGCHKMHSVGGVVGPDLTYAGERRRDPGWHLKHFRAPQQVVSGSQMPPFAHLPEQELQSLTVYMLSLRHAVPGLLAK
jgi:cytochrome c2